MKLFYSPGACSIGIHLLLEEIGKPYETHKVSFADGEQYKPEFTALNPKSKVPTLLLDDGAVLTEFPAIAMYLALSNPQAKLLPEGALAVAKSLEVLEYAVATQHMQAFSRMFRPGKYNPDESQADATRAAGKEMVIAGFAILDGQLAGKGYVAGDSFSIGDAALFYVEFWAAKRLGITLPANCAAHFARVAARPAAQRVLKDEGFGD